MKGILGCDADWLQPGQIVATPDGRLMTVLHKITVGEALESAENLGVKVEPIGNEQWYAVEVEVAVTKAMSN